MGVQRCLPADRAFYRGDRCGCRFHFVKHAIGVVPLKALLPQAKSGKNVSEMFQAIAEALPKGQPAKAPTVQLQARTEEDGKKSCCA